ncbi:biotin-dependent carboxyltransferase family protein [Streptomyces sp. TM32]|uniref:5-oxoprolinase subunit C family protein n=1 Tax=Streptomyces sp. TM32 TaxID=1652669 RepID=UPI00101103ED|nr:biotin-dependent carboxyltransferase family protein [Streptomyces sp. TM32]RXS88409.1 biotin-dependent carboxyltransferase family protein [Streptomyces sp. TM32]
MIEILRPGPLTTVQDLGRPGHAALGVGTGGAADRGSLRLANRLVGNAESAAALELTCGGLTARCHTPTTLALTGAPCPAALDGRQIGMNGPVHAAAGQELTVGFPTRALRTYLALRGGIDVPPVLGSRSTDTLSGIGPAPLSAGASLSTGTAALRFPPTDFAPRREFPDRPVLHLVPGPRDDWFAPEALTTLCADAYEVTADSDRVGARLAGPLLERAIHHEMPSEGMVRGALQVPPNGQPVLFLADHPVTGGYPVIAVVHDADLDQAAQLRPGQTVRFRPAPRRRTTRNRRAHLSMTT